MEVGGSVECDLLFAEISCLDSHRTTISAVQQPYVDIHVPSSSGLGETLVVVAPAETGWMEIQSLVEWFYGNLPPVSATQGSKSQWLRTGIKQKDWAVFNGEADNDEPGQTKQ